MIVAQAPLLSTSLATSLRKTLPSSSYWMVSSSIVSAILNSTLWIKGWRASAARYLNYI